jgi:uncharacterized surface protein with fasciclin (FAS1) repeats
LPARHYIFIEFKASTIDQTPNMKASIAMTSLFTAIATAQSQYMTSLLAMNPNLSTFGDVLRNVSSFAGALNGKYNMTIVIPTNQAFEALLAGPDSFERRAVAGRNRDDLEKLLSYHVLDATYTSANFTEVPKYASTLEYSMRGASNLDASNFTGPTVKLVKSGMNATILGSGGKSSNVVEAVRRRLCLLLFVSY